MYHEVCCEQWINIKRLKSAIETQIFDKNGRPTRKPKRKDALRIMSSSWQFIDSTYRIGKLANYIKGLSHREDGYVWFEEEVRKLKDFRNIFQHLDKHIRTLENGDNPIMGLFSWVCNNKKISITLSVGMLAPGASVYGIFVDRFEGKFVTELQFSASNQNLDLISTKSALDKFMAYFEIWLSENDFVSEQVIEPSTLIFDIAGMPNA